MTRGSEDLVDALADLIAQAFSASSANALCGLEMKHPGLDFPILIPFSQRDKVSARKVLSVIEQVSHFTFLPSYVHLPTYPPPSVVRSPTYLPPSVVRSPTHHPSYVRLPTFHHPSYVHLPTYLPPSIVCFR